jgi:hypothetical protein
VEDIEAAASGEAGVVEAGSAAAASAALGEAVPEAVAPAAAGSEVTIEWFLTRRSTSS